MKPGLFLRLVAFWRGAVIIYCRGQNGAIQDEDFWSLIEATPLGPASWRYALTRIGGMQVFKNGTAYYCGKVRWALWPGHEKKADKLGLLIRSEPTP